MMVTPVVLCASRATLAVYFVHPNFLEAWGGSLTADHSTRGGSSGCRAITHKCLRSETTSKWEALQEYTSMHYEDHVEFL
jgi:hypothetical protein